MIVLPDDVEAFKTALIETGAAQALIGYLQPVFCDWVAEHGVIGRSDRSWVLCHHSIEGRAQRFRA
jgi:hypothetical protein